MRPGKSDEKKKRIRHRAFLKARILIGEPQEVDHAIILKKLAKYNKGQISAGKPAVTYKQLEKE